MATIVGTTGRRRRPRSTLIAAAVGLGMVALPVLFGPLAQAPVTADDVFEDRFAYAAAAWLHPTAYVLGGETSLATSGHVRPFEPSTNHSGLPTAVLIPGRSRASAATDGETIYIFGGRTGIGPSSEILAYDPSGSGPAQHVDDLPSAREGTAAVVLNGDIYVIGGAPGPLDEVVRYDLPGRDVRETPVSLPTGVSYAAAATDGAAIFVFGGEDAAGPTDLIQRIDPQERTAEELGTTLPWPLARAQAVWTGEDVLLFGGVNDTGNTSGAILRYTPATDTMAIMTDELTKARKGAAAVWTGTEGLAFGGISATEEYLDDVERYNPVSDVPRAVYPHARPEISRHGMRVTADAAASYDLDGTIASVLWDWGDGTPPSAGVAATHRYGSAGTYTIALTVTDDAGLRDRERTQVPASNLDPVCDFVVSVDGLSVAADAEGSFDRDGDIEGYGWEWGDQGSTLGGPTAVRTYAEAGPYAVRLTVTDDLGGTCELTRPVTVGLPPQAPTAQLTLTGSDRTVTAHGTGSLDADGSIATYAWDWGDGAPASAQRLAVHTYATAGSYTVTLHVVDDDGLDDTASLTVTVPLWSGPKPAFTFSTEGLTLSVDGRGSSGVDAGGSYAWDWGDGTLAGSGPTASHTYVEAGSYVVRLEVTDEATVTAAIEQVVTFVEGALSPVAAFETRVDGLAVHVDASGSYDPDGETIEATWDWGDGTDPGSGLAAGHTYVIPGRYRVRLTVADAVGANAATARTVEVQGSLPGAPRDVYAVAGGSRGAISLLWQPPEGQVPVEAYRIYRQQPSGASQRLTDVAEATFTDRGLAPGTTYSYRVSALGTLGEGPASGWVQATAPGEGVERLGTRELVRTSIPGGEQVVFYAGITGVEIDFDSQDLPLALVGASFADRTGLMAVAASRDEAPPEGVLAPPGGALSYFSIVLTADGLPVEPQETYLHVRLPHALLGQEELRRDEVVALRLAAGTWSPLATRFLNATSEHAYFRVDPPGFSTFAIVGDTTPPSVTFHHVDNLARTEPGAALQWTIVDALGLRRVELRVDGTNVTDRLAADNATTTTRVVTFPAPTIVGNHTVILTAVDLAGHTETGDWGLTVVGGAGPSTIPSATVAALVGFGALAVGVLAVPLVRSGRRARLARSAGRVPATAVAPSAAGRYELVREIGGGGAGRVYLAHDKLLDRKVVVKRLRSSSDMEARERVQREAQSASRVVHPNLVPLHDVTRIGGADVLVMEFVEGGSLQRRLEQGPLPAPVVARIADGILRGLAALHAAGVVHRDLKPANILLTTDLVPKISDFGIARTPGQPKITATGAQPGTLLYMSPEQARGDPVDVRTDLYSCAVVIYEMLTRRSYLDAVPMREYAIRTAIIEKAPGLPVPELGEALNAVLARALAKDPDHRFQSAEAMRQELARAMRAG